MKLISGTVGKVAKNADKLGALLGFLTGSPNGFNDVTSSIQNASRGIVHIPDVNAFAEWAKRPYLSNGIMLYVAGTVADELSLPIIGKYGKAIQKGALGYVAGSLANKVLWAMTHADEGSDPTKRGFNSPAVNTGDYPY